MLEADIAALIRDKTDFVGRAGNARAGAASVEDRLRRVAATDTDARGGEPVLVKDR